MEFTHRFREGSFEGYVLEVEPRFFLIAALDERLSFDGFLCVRVSDVRGLQVPSEYAAFREAVLKKRHERKPRKPRVSVLSIEELLLSANRVFPLVVICRDQIKRNVCWVGRILKISKGRVTFLQINPDAVWDEEPVEYKLSEITRIDFGGGYEEALSLVGGLP